MRHARGQRELQINALNGGGLMWLKEVGPGNQKPA
jgi:hypothetical protein